MSTEKRIAINTLSRYASRIVVMGTGFFLTPYLIDELGRSMLGLMVLADQVLRYCMLINSSASQGFARFATVHHAKGEYEQMNNILGRGLSFVAILAIPSFLMVALASFFSGTLFGLPQELIPYARIVILVSGIGAIVRMFLGIWNVALFIKQKFYVADISNIITRLSSAILVVLIFTYYKPSIVIWVMLVVGIGLVMNLSYVVPMAKQCLPEMRIRPVWGWLRESKELVSFSGMAFFASLGYLLYYAADSVMISNLNELGAEKIIVYNVAQRWDPMIRQFVLAFAMAMTPALTGIAALGEYEKLKKVFYRGLRYSQIIGFLPCVLLYVYSHQFITLWIDVEMANESAPILRLMMLNLALCVPAIMCYQVFVALGKIFAAGVSTIVGGVLNVVIGIIFVKVFHLGLFGIALSTFITLGVKTAIVLPFLMKHYLNLKVLDFIRYGIMRAFLSIAPVAMVAFFLKMIWVPKSWLVLLVHFSICSLCFLITVYTYGFVDEDRMKVKAVCRKIIGKVVKNR